MGDGLTNSQIENFFQKEENEDLKNNFMGVFSMDFTTKFISFRELIKEKKKENILLQYLIPILIINQEHIGGVFLILNQKVVYFYLIVMG